MPKTKKLLSTLLIAAAVMLAAANPALADGTDVDALSARVGQLEMLVEQLLKERDQTQRELYTLKEENRRQAATVGEMDARLQTASESAKEAISKVASAPKDDAPTNSYVFGGYIKTDAIYSNYSDGDLPSTSLGRDFYVPGLIPVGGEGESTDFDSHARETRLFFRNERKLANGDTLKGYVELDFLVTTEGNERVSNSYVPRMRHAYLSTSKWLIGQTWSTFQNVGALPDNLDFVGPAEGTVFERQPMLRYSTGPWQFALENRETTLTPFGGGARITTDDGGLPDIIARYTRAGDWGNLVVAGIYRELNFEDPGLGIDDSESAFGISASGTLRVGDRDDFRWMVSTGSGMGRYMGLNTANGAVIDANGELEAIDSSGAFASYRHFWNSRWRSSFTLSFLDIDNDPSLTGPSVTDESMSVHLNLIYQPRPKLEIGVELLHAERELVSGADGNLDRLQFSTKYSF